MPVEEVISKGAAAYAQDYGASPETASKLGDVFSSVVQLNPAVAAGTTLTNAAASDKPESIASATLTGLDLVNPLGKMQRLGEAVSKALPEPEITPVADVLAPAAAPPAPAATPAADVLAPAVTPPPGPPLRSSLILPQPPQIVMPSREILLPEMSLAYPVNTGHGAAPAGAVGMRGTGPLQGGRISQRVPTSPKSTEDPYTDNLLINMDVLRSQPEKVVQAADLISTYPGFGSKAMNEMDAPARLEAQRKQMTDNLLYLYDNMSPEERSRAMQWHLGANRISRERAAETGFHPTAWPASMLACRRKRIGSKTLTSATR